MTNNQLKDKNNKILMMLTKLTQELLQLPS